MGFLSLSRELGRKTVILPGILLLLFALPGCLYPDEQKAGGGDVRESVKRVQAAIDDYQHEEGLLPILNSDAATPRYEKFVIDLEKLRQKGYLSEIPAAAFEKGGSAYFLILDEETDPVVKLMDLVTVQKVNDVQRQVDRYKSAHGGKLPAGEERYPGLYLIDSREAGTADIKLNSIYSGQLLEFIMDQDGRVYVDYSLDIMSAIDREGVTPEANKDLRLVLEQASYYVPVKSLPFLWIEGEPVPQPEGK